MEEKRLLEMTGTVEQIIFRNEKNEYTVLELNNGQEMCIRDRCIPHAGC